MQMCEAILRFFTEFYSNYDFRIFGDFENFLGDFLLNFNGTIYLEKITISTVYVK